MPRLAAISVILASCATGTPHYHAGQVPVFLVVDDSAEQFADEVAQAVDRWNELSGAITVIYCGVHDWPTRGTADVGIIIGVFASDQCEEAPRPETAASAWIRHTEDLEILSSEITLWQCAAEPYDARLAVLHELGHLFGLDHGPGLMCDHMGCVTDHLTDDQIATVRGHAGTGA